MTRTPKAGGGDRLWPGWNSGYVVGDHDAPTAIAHRP
jgi:hypothetical protein